MWTKAKETDIFNLRLHNTALVLKYGLLLSIHFSGKLMQNCFYAVLNFSMLTFWPSISVQK